MAVADALRLSAHKSTPSLPPAKVHAPPTGRRLKGQCRSKTVSHRRLEPVPELETSPERRSRSCEQPAPARPKWHVFFGSVRLPGEMEMSDIRSRQRRKGVQEEGRKVVPDVGRKRWRLLLSLSCSAGQDAVAPCSAASGEICR